jgi:hypothetical protein
LKNGVKFSNLSGRVFQKSNKKIWFNWGTFHLSRSKKNPVDQEKSHQILIFKRRISGAEVWYDFLANRDHNQDSIPETVSIKSRDLFVHVDLFFTRHRFHFLNDGGTRETFWIVNGEVVALEDCWRDLGLLKKCRWECPELREPDCHRKIWRHTRSSIGVGYLNGSQIPTTATRFGHILAISLFPVQKVPTFLYPFKKLAYDP